MADPLDLELSIRRAASPAGEQLPGYTAEVRLRLGGDSELFFGPYPLLIDPAALARLTDSPREYGAALTDGMFADPGVMAAYFDARARASTRNVALRVRLNIHASAPELHSLVWELLCDPASQLPLSLNERVLFSRYLPPRPDAEAGLPPLRGSLHVLAAAANPSNLSAYQLARIDTLKELARAEASLAPLRVERLPRAPGDLCTLNRLLERGRTADILYLACHGAYRRKVSALFLEGDDGKVKRAVGADLAARVAQMDARPRLVVLASCESAGSTAGEALRAFGPLLVEAGVPAVLAVQGPVSMATMDIFLPVLFRELAQDGRIDRAVAAARQAAGDQPDWWAPVLFMNLLSGRLWQPEVSGPNGGPAPVIKADVPHEVPAPPANFIGRAAELEEMTLAIENGVQVINIHGTNGVGRTATARELVRRTGERFTDGQVNLDMLGGSAGVNAAQALAYVIQKFDPTIAQLPADENLLRGRLQSLLFGRRALILLDNVADLAQVAPFFPLPSGCLVLLTSWERFDSEEVSIFNRRLGKLEPQDAVRLLVTLAPRSEPVAAELAARCEYLPQALDGVARRLNKVSGLTPEDLLVLLDDAQERLAITGVDATLQVSYEMLSEAQKFDWLRLGTFSADFTASAAAWVWGRVDATTSPDRLRSRIIRARLDLDDLIGYGLVEYDGLSDRYSLHNLERDYIASLDDLEPDEINAARLAHASCFQAVLERSGELYLQGSQRMLEGLALFDREAREIRAAWAWLQPSDGVEETRERLTLRAHYPAAFSSLMTLRLMPDERLRWMESGLAAARALGDSRLESLLLGSLGVAYYILDRYSEALECQAQALQSGLVYARQPGGECGSLVRALGNLGSLYRVMRKRARALRYLNKQLELARRTKLPREEGRALGILGRVYLDLGDTDQSIACYQAELAITDQTGDRRARAIVLGGLGDVYRVLKDFDRARQLLEEDVAITREIGDRRGQAIASWMLGKVYNDMGDLAKAVEWMQVLVDYEKEIGHQDAGWHAEKVADLQAQLRDE